jgi:uncharacterized LabA/DUF88 family protein
VFLKDKYDVYKAFIFIGHIPGNEKLYRNLEKYGYVLIFKPTLEFKKQNKSKIKGNVDAELVLHTMIEFEHYNKAVIVSGDGDFHCLIEYLDQKRKLLKVLVPSQKYSSLLRKFANYIVQIQSIKEKVKK